ncbi:hypothetical protein RRG08_014234 [Elysia crispata]|uniref:Uncharacterized protein n=1 Tax=Elysia crispata TaxID=231223 RepID=A0AAE0XEF0_9GAST|nr:hypothetical protein RRG08_014234 [Elysia crispata]
MSHVTRSVPLINSVALLVQACQAGLKLDELLCVMSRPFNFVSFISGVFNQKSIFCYVSCCLCEQPTITEETAAAPRSDMKGCSETQ